MNISLSKVSFILLTLCLVGGACGKTVAEKATERAIESSTNSDVDVDLDQSKVSVNTNGVAWEAGESVDLPDGFPDDVYITNGTLKVVTTIDETSGYSVTMETSTDVATVKSEYEREMAADGWTVTGTATFGVSTTITADKGDRMMTVGIFESDGKTQIHITTGRSD